MRWASLVDWTAIGAIATGVYTVAFVVSMWLIGRQIKEARLSRDTELLLSFYDRFTQSSEKHQIIHQNEHLLRTVSSLGEWDQLRRDHPDLAAAVVDVSLDYHLAGLFLRSGILRERSMFLQDIGEVYLRLHPIILPAINIERGRSGGSYRRDLDTLAEYVRAVLHVG